MKLIFSIALTLSSSLALAGPEDHIQAQRCYLLVADDPHTVSKKVPTRVCVEDVSLDVATSKVSIYSYFFSQLFVNLITSTVIRTTEDTYKFRASSEIYEGQDSVCGFSEKVALIIKGQSDFLGTVNNETLNISAQHSSLADACHSEPVTTEYSYQLDR